jgi:glutathione S-transferase
MLATPAVLLSAVATILAILVCIFNVMLVGRARNRYGVAAPAMSGHPVFERAMRVQMNTLEQFVIFVPALWLATLYFHMIGYAPGLLGILWCVGRLVYAGGYMADPGKRHIGFGLTALATILLIVLAAIGIVNAWTVS